MELKVSACHSLLVSRGLGCRKGWPTAGGLFLAAVAFRRREEMSNQLPCGGGRRWWLACSLCATLGKLPQAQKVTPTPLTPYPLSVLCPGLLAQQDRSLS